MAAHQREGEWQISVKYLFEEVFNRFVNIAIQVLKAALSAPKPLNDT